MSKKRYRLKEVGPFFKHLPDDLTFMNIEDIRELPIVRIRWLDACSDSGWSPMSEYRSYAEGIECESVGFLIKNSRGALQIVQSIAKTGKVAESLTVPKSEVREVKVLRE